MTSQVTIKNYIIGHFINTLWAVRAYKLTFFLQEKYRINYVNSKIYIYCIILPAKETEFNLKNELEYVCSQTVGYAPVVICEFQIQRFKHVDYLSSTCVEKRCNSPLVCYLWCRGCPPQVASTSVHESSRLVQPVIVVTYGQMFEGQSCRNAKHHQERAKSRRVFVAVCDDGVVDQRW